MCAIFLFEIVNAILMKLFVMIKTNMTDQTLSSFILKLIIKIDE